MKNPAALNHSCVMIRTNDNIEDSYKTFVKIIEASHSQNTSERSSVEEG